MKKNINSIIIIALMILFAYIGASSAKGDNFKAPEKEKVEFKDSTTNHTYEIKEIKYPVFRSKNGAFYIWKTSNKTGKKYKYYLPKEIQEKMGRKYENK